MKRWLMGVVSIFAVTAPLAGQRRGERMALPRNVAAQVISVFDDPKVTMYEGGGAEIRAREVVRGNVAVLEGRLALRGEVTGDVVVINGDLLLDSFATVRGDVIVLGGTLAGSERSVEGRVVVSADRVAYERRAGRIRFQERGPRRYSGEGPRPRSRISIRTGGSYNRVEGLPLMVGPIIESGGWNHIRVDAQAIWRSEGGFRVDPDEVGYLVRGEQHLGERTQLVLGATAHSVIGPVEPTGLSDLENSLAVVVLHEDYRDYFEREGLSGYARVAVPSDGFTATVEYRDEEHAFVPAGDPWTWRRKERQWRAQPLIGEGTVRSVRGELEVDRRNSRRDPSDGWFLNTGATMGVGGSFQVPEYLQPAPAPQVPVQAARALDTDFRDGFVDLRAYYRVGPSSDFRLRGFVAGSLDDRPLPPQYQHALGGVGTLPGHSQFAADCGARSARYSVVRTKADTTGRFPVYAGYGCDRVALFQAEYRGSFDFEFGYGSDGSVQDWGWSPVVDFNPSWSVFFDAGRGWTLSDPTSPSYLGGDSAELVDAGVGLFLGDLGLYWAWPIRGGGNDATFFVRLDHRF